MARVTQLQTNFTAGEISPKVYGRVDVARYQNGAKAVRDLIVQVYGGVKRRPGSLFVHEVKTSAKATRLIPFIRNATTAYAIEMGDLYMRFYKDGALIESSPGVPYEIVSPYSEARLFEVDYTQGADTMFMFHEAVTPYKLVCAGDTSWTLTAAALINTPFEEQGEYPAATLTPGLTGPVGATITLAAGNPAGTPKANSGFSWSGGMAVVGCVGHGFATGDIVAVRGVAISGWNIAAAQITVTGVDNFQFPLPINPGAPTADFGESQKFTGTAIFAAGDVDRSVRINGGIVKITSFLSTSAVNGIIKQELLSTEPSPRDAWSIHRQAWSVTLGYPRTGTLYEQRLVAAGSPTFPQTIWGSVTGAYLDFQQGVADDDAFSFTIASDIANPIRYVAASRSLLALTTGGEFTIQGGAEKPLAPTNAQIKPRKNYGCASVRPVRVGDSELFVQRAGRKVRNFGYSLANDDWIGTDLSVLAEHLTEGDIADMTWQQEPDSIVWLARGDGALASITMDKEQDVTAWQFHDGFGRDGTVFVESLTSIPTSAGDEVWMIVRRTVNGSSKRYVERLSEDTRVDCSVVSTGASATVWSGLDHLEGETVQVVANGHYAGEFTVTSGDITLERAATEVMMGLGYSSRLTLLDPEIQTGMGSASGNAMRTSEVSVRFNETTGCKVNGKPMQFRALGPEVLDQPPPSFSGVKRLENLGWGRGEDELEFTQDEPMPFHILSVTRKFTTNDG
jgi:hypothetical protein